MKIQPIKTVFNGELAELKIRVNGFDIEDGKCILTWIFLDKEGSEVKSGNYILTQEEYDNWGSENNYLFTVFCEYFKNSYGVVIEPLEDINTKTTEKDGI
jgi:hypothetical protein